MSGGGFLRDRPWNTTARTTTDAEALEGGPAAVAAPVASVWL
jgi:hypothetical protein